MHQAPSRAKSKSFPVCFRRCQIASGRTPEAAGNRGESWLIKGVYLSRPTLKYFLPGHDQFRGGRRGLGCARQGQRPPLRRLKSGQRCRASDTGPGGLSQGAAGAGEKWPAFIPLLGFSIVVFAEHFSPAVEFWWRSLEIGTRPASAEITSSILIAGPGRPSGHRHQSVACFWLNTIHRQVDQRYWPGAASPAEQRSHLKPLRSPSLDGSRVRFGVAFAEV